MFFGEALAKIGVITEEDVIKQLKEFNELRKQRSVQ
jgi:hypothetical protein